MCYVTKGCHVILKCWWPGDRWGVDCSLCADADSSTADV